VTGLSSTPELTSSESTGEYDDVKSRTSVAVVTADPANNGVAAASAEAKQAQLAALQAAVDAANAQIEAVREAAIWKADKSKPIIMAFDGPARDYDSHKPFVYTLPTLFNDKEKYSQLLWWYFGGKAYRLTKAIRIPLNEPDEAEDVESLFIGFAGPGGDPGA
jgi:hypothetical protein